MVVDVLNGFLFLQIPERGFLAAVIVSSPNVSFSAKTDILCER